MYILVVGNGTPSPEYPCNGVFEFDQARALSSLGHKVVYAAVDLRSVRRRRKLGLVIGRRHDISIYSFNLPVGPIRRQILRRVFSVVLSALFGVISKREGTPDIVHGHFGIGAGFACSLLCSKRRLPLVITEHDSNINEGKLSESDVRDLRKAYLGADCVVAVGRSLARKIQEYTHVVASIIPNVVDASCFEYRETKPHEDYNFVSVGSLVHGKGMDILIRSFEAAFATRERVKLSIFGEGEQRDRLARQIRDAGLGERVHLRGLCSRQVIADEFSVSDCFVLASRAETFGVAYIEALSAGLPVIATRCGGPEDFIDPTCGLLVSVNDEQGLTASLRHMEEHSHSYHGNQISVNAIARFSPGVVGRELIHTYSKVLQNPEELSIDLS